MPIDNTSVNLDHFTEGSMKTTTMKYLFEDRPLEGSLETEMAWKLYQVLDNARQSGTLVYGLFSAGKLLERSPQRAKLCVMSKEDEDVDPGAGILMYLLESHCWAMNVPVVRVKKFSRILESFGIKTLDGDKKFNEHCLLVKTGSGKQDGEDLTSLIQMGFAKYNEGKDFEVDVG